MRPRSTTSGVYVSRTSASPRSSVSTYAGKVEGPMLNSYLSLNKDPVSGQYHPLLKDLEDAVRIINGVNQVARDADWRRNVPLAGSSYLSRSSHGRGLPAQRHATRQPGAIRSRSREGSCCVLARRYRPDILGDAELRPGQLLRNAVLWATNEPAPLIVEGKGVLDVSLWMQKNSMTAHLVNLTNPMMMKGPIREIIPITAQQVSVQIPAGRRVKQVQLLVAGTKPNYTNKEGLLQLEVPSIALHEVVAIDFS